MLKLIAVDPEEAVIREDGFLLEVAPETEIKIRLTVACILPTGGFQYKPETFVRNMYRLQGESKVLLYDRSRLKVENPGLQKDFPKEVLLAIYEIDTDGVLHENLAIDTATVEGLSFREFVILDDFMEMKSLIEEFLHFDPIIWDWYRSPVVKEHWTNDTIGHRLVGAMQSMFNKTCSAFAYRKKIMTIKKKDVEISYGVHTGVVPCTGPYRKAETLVNISNITDYLKGNPLYYTADRLRSFDLHFHEQRA